MDRCRVWESHADPAARRVSKPSPDPIYPAYVVGDSDNISETTQVAAVTRLKSGPDQLEDLLRRLLTTVDTPALIPEVPVVEKLLQHLVAETQSRPPPVVSHPESVGLEMMLCCDSVMLRLGAQTCTRGFRICCRDDMQRTEKTPGGGGGGGYYDPTPAGDGP